MLQIWFVENHGIVVPQLS